MYIDDIVDILPPGFTYGGIVEEFDSSTTSVLLGTTCSNKSYYDALVDFVQPEEKEETYKVVNISVTSTSNDGRQQVKFSVTGDFSGNSIAYDERVKKIILLLKRLLCLHLLVTLVKQLWMM